MTATKTHTPHLQRNAAESASWGFNLVVGNIQALRDLELTVLKMFINDEIVRRKSSASIAEEVSK